MKFLNIEYRHEFSLKEDLWNYRFLGKGGPLGCWGKRGRGGHGAGGGGRGGHWCTNRVSLGKRVNNKIPKVTYM